MPFVQVTGKSKRNVTPPYPPQRGITNVIMEVYLRTEVMFQWAAIAEGSFLSNPYSVFFPAPGC